MRYMRWIVAKGSDSNRCLILEYEFADLGILSEMDFCGGLIHLYLLYTLLCICSLSIYLAVTRCPSRLLPEP